MNRVTSFQPKLSDIRSVILSCIQNVSDNNDNNINDGTRRENCLLLIQCLVDMTISLTSGHDDNSHDDNSHDDDDDNMMYCLKLILLISVKMIIYDTTTSTDIINMITIIISKIMDHNTIITNNMDKSNINYNECNMNIKRIKMICTITMSYIYQLFSIQPVINNNNNNIATTTKGANSTIPDTSTLKIALFLFNIWTSASTKLIQRVIMYSKYN